MKKDVHLGRHAHAVELLLPVARRHGVVHEHDELEAERLAPTHHDLSMNQAVVDSKELQRHFGAPPIATIDALPRSAA